MSLVLDAPVTLVPVVVPTDGQESQPVDGACLALRVLSQYASLTGESKTASVRELVVNLVADLMHVSEQSGLSFEAIVAEAGRVASRDHQVVDNVYAVA